MFSQVIKSVIVVWIAKVIVQLWDMLDRKRIGIASVMIPEEP